MSTRLEAASWKPPVAWWALLGVLVASGLMLNWWVALGVLAFILINAARPLDFLPAFLVVMGGGAFAYYEGGNLFHELTLLSGAILVMLFCYMVTSGSRVLSVARSRLTLLLLVFLAWSFASFARAMLAGHPFKNALTELLGVLALSSALLVANVFDPRRHMMLAFAAMLLTAYGSAGIGFYVFSIIHTRTAGIFFHSVPGLVAIFLVNRALRSRSFANGLVWVTLSLPLFLHQFLSYRRALWIGCLVSLVVSLFIYTGFGRGSSPRWRRAGLVLGTIIGLGLTGALGMAVLYGQQDIVLQAAARFTSIGSTKFEGDWRGATDQGTLSNVERLIEYGVIAKLIREAPVFGYGLGYNFVVSKPFIGAHRQWWAHQNYLLIWLKQGIIGLGLFLLLLWTAFRLGAREARWRSDPWESAWFGTMAAATVFQASFALTDIPFAYVNTTFLLALFWGGAVAMTRPDRFTVRW